MERNEYHEITDRYSILNGKDSVEGLSEEESIEFGQLCSKLGLPTPKQVKRFHYLLDREDDSTMADEERRELRNLESEFDKQDEYRMKLQEELFGQPHELLDNL